MPKDLRQLTNRDAYCSAPPLYTSLRPPRLLRDVEVRRPRAPIVEVKKEVGSSIESAEFVIDEEFDLKSPKIEFDPRQLQRSIAALAVVPSPTSESSSASGRRSARPIKLGCADSAAEQNPGGDLGPADPPRRRGCPKGSKTRPRVAFSLTTLLERKAKLEAERHLADMSNKNQV